MRALKHCEWEALPGMDDCVALEGSMSYFAYSWVAGESPRITYDSGARKGNAACFACS